MIEHREGVSFRVSGRVLSGRALVYGDISPDFNERFLPGAFGEVRTVPVNLQHDPRLVVSEAATLIDSARSLDVRADLPELRRQSNRRDQLMLKLGAAKKDAGRAWFLVEVDVPHTDEKLAAHGLTYRLRRKKLRQVFRREGRYLLRSNMTGEDPAALWRHYMQLTEIEQAFKELKHNLAIRPIFHQLEQRIEAHIFVSFIAYCLLVTLKNLARPQAPGLTPRAIVEKFAAIQMVDLHVPTADGRHLVLARHTQPSEDHELLLRQLDLALPKQPAPKLLS